MEKEEADALEMAAQAHEERKKETASEINAEEETGRRSFKGFCIQ